MTERKLTTLSGLTAFVLGFYCFTPLLVVAPTVGGLTVMAELLDIVILPLFGVALFLNVIGLSLGWRSTEGDSHGS